MKLALSIDDVQSRIPLGRTRIYEAINNGELKAKKYGKKTFILQQDLEDFLATLQDFNGGSDA